jgi:hypothetical protein
MIGQLCRPSASNHGRMLRACRFGLYASIAGGLNPKQPDLIRQGYKAMPVGSEIVSVTHGDPEGERYVGSRLFANGRHPVVGPRFARGYLTSA